MNDPIRILFVEDSVDDMLIVLELLREGGFTPQYARVETAEAMQEALRAGTWDIVLADHALPHFSGPAAIEVLRASGRDIPCIVVSGTITEQQAIDLMRSGACDFIFKQQLARLLPAIRRELREAQNRREKRDAQAALERERAFLSSAIDMLPFPIIFNALDGAVIRANRASYAFFGELTTETWWHRQLLIAQTRQAVPPDQWPMMRAARGEVVPASEGILVLPGNREVDVLAVAAPVSVREEIVATVVAFLDITPIKDVDRAKTRFLNVLSHELRTPLTNILGWAKLAQESPEMAGEALQVIIRNADTQHHMLEVVLELSRWLYGHLDLHYEPLELWSVVREVVDAYAPRAEARRIALASHPPGTPLPVLGDRKRLREVVENLLENALLVTAAGGQISVRGERRGARARVSVRDSGQGIDPAVLPRVFEMFHLAPEVEQAGGGLGLALPLAKALVEAHDGAITAESPGIGRGSTVTIDLPLREGNA